MIALEVLQKEGPDQGTGVQRISRWNTMSIVCSSMWWDIDILVNYTYLDTTDQNTRLYEHKYMALPAYKQ